MIRLRLGWPWPLSNRAFVLGLALLLGGLGPAWGEFRVGLVLDRGGKDDKSFNTSAYEGCNLAKNKFGVQVKYVEATDDNAFEPLMRCWRWCVSGRRG